MTGFDLSTISAAYLGSTPINEIYFGSTKIWPAGLPIGTTYDFAYTGTVQSQELPAGTYKLQVWGAQGGSSTGTYAAEGSKGGYSEGILTLTQTTTLYVFVGGAGETIDSSSTSTAAVNGGWNGGGGSKPYNASSSRYSYPRPGGGATDIALVTSTMDYSSNRTNRSSDSLLSRIIVAGGGGGSSYYRYSSTTYSSFSGASVGGGISGEGTFPGTQSNAGSGGGFGYGANQLASSRCLGGAGGAGWYGGGTGGSSTASLNNVRCAGGGSGFVNIPANSSYRPTGFTGLEMDFGVTTNGKEDFEAVSGGIEYGHEGDGYARITCIDTRQTPLTFDILEDGTIGMKMTQMGSERTVFYRINGGSWTMVTVTKDGTTISVSNGDVIQFVGTYSFYGLKNGSTYDYFFFTSTCDFNVRGNLNSLLSFSDSITQDYALAYLFYNNTHLISAENLVLPSNTATGCYYNMFSGCTSLTTAPVLPATTLTSYCYYEMFKNCSSLTNIKCLAVTKGATSCLSNWVSGVAATGTFVKAESATWSIGTGGIPSGWFVQNDGDSPKNEYLTFIILSSGYIGWKASNSSLTKTIQYKKNDGEWRSKTSSTLDSSTVGISVSAGDVLRFRGDNASYGNSSYYNTFTATCSFTVKGNVMSLISSTAYVNLDNFTESYALRGLFYGNTYLQNAENLILPPNTYARCYQAMFRGCTSLTKGPDLPAATLATYAYYNLFYDCSSLKYIKCLATDLSATNCTQTWVNGVGSGGTFVKASGVTWSTGTSGIPSGWTVEDAS